ncbi:MAG: hypothetical protein ABIC91_08855 [Nanoarchaeota archaeon]|nr:hypothetical protein [Nanoarchaeota archaeon]MBU1029805.1 hypothetical protein [Nanoarchaeota archaeon]MBU1850050.1 hypothetical protein [Nanoarchaeota archaeon]
MVKKKTCKKCSGKWAFVTGFILALVFGLFGIQNSVAWLLVILGLIVGFLNITEKETHAFLIESAILVVVSALGSDVMNVIPIIGNILDAILMLFVPATIMAALKSVFDFAKDK